MIVSIRRSFRLRIAFCAVLVAVLTSLIAPPSAEALSRPAAKTIATGLSEVPCRYALLASKGTTAANSIAVVAYLDGDTLKTRRSLNAGVTWESARTISLSEDRGWNNQCVAVVATSTYFYLVADTWVSVKVDPTCEEYVDENWVGCDTIDTSILLIWRSTDGKTWRGAGSMDSSYIEEFRVSASPTQLFIAAMSRSNIAPDCDATAEECPADTTTVSVYETGTNNVVFGRAIELVTDVGSDAGGSALFLLGGGSIATLTWTDSEGASLMRSRIGARNWRAPIVLGASQSPYSDGISASSGKSVFVAWTTPEASSFQWNVSVNSGSKFPGKKVKADSIYDSAQIRSVWPIGAKFGVAVYRWESWDDYGDYAVTDIYTATASSATKRWSMRLGEICVGGVYVESKVLVVGRLETTVLTWDDDLGEYSESSTYSLYSYTSAP
jgi:hypothetical protein